MITFDYTRHLDVLGRLVSNGQALEIAIAKVLARELGVADHVGLIVAGRANAKGVLSMITDLTESDEVRDWVKQTSRALEGRNRFIHGVWGAEEEGGDLSTFMHRGKTVEVDNLIETMGVVVEQLYACAVRAGELATRCPSLSALHQLGREREGRAADARPCLREHDARHLRRPVRRRSGRRCYGAR